MEKRFCTFRGNSYQQNTREDRESLQDRIKRWFIPHKYSFKAHNSHNQEQQIVKCSFAIKISTPKACHKFLLFFARLLLSKSYISYQCRKGSHNKFYLFFCKKVISCSLSILTIEFKYAPYMLVWIHFSSYEVLKVKVCIQN